MICRAFVLQDGEQDQLARRLLLEKYTPRYSGDLLEWAKTAVAVAIELPEPPAAG